MRNVLKRGSLPKIITSVLFALLLISLSATLSVSSIFSYTHYEEETPVSTDETAAAKSMDVDEGDVAEPNVNTANTADQTNLYTDIPGIGSFFGNMLDSLISLTKDTENRFQSLTHHVPLVFPDLYKVLITL